MIKLANVLSNLASKCNIYSCKCFAQFAPTKPSFAHRNIVLQLLKLIERNVSRLWKLGCELGERVVEFWSVEVAKMARKCVNAKWQNVGRCKSSRQLDPKTTRRHMNVIIWIENLLGEKRRFVDCKQAPFCFAFNCVRIVGCLRV